MGLGIGGRAVWGVALPQTHREADLERAFCPWLPDWEQTPNSACQIDKLYPIGLSDETRLRLCRNLASMRSDAQREALRCDAGRCALGVVGAQARCSTMTARSPCRSLRGSHY
jgi:hypothetical protein